MRGSWPRRPRPGGRLVGEHFLANGKPKRSFPTKAAAERFVEETKQNAKPYRCGFCPNFHIASVRTPNPPKRSKP